MGGVGPAPATLLKYAVLIAVVVALLWVLGDVYRGEIQNQDLPVDVINSDALGGQKGDVLFAIFLLAAAWAAVLVPLLFAGRLRSLEDAAASAQDAYDEIKAQLVASAEESKRQLRNISRYQLIQLGFFQNDGSLNIYEDAASKKEFIDTAWAQAEPKVQQALELLHGATRNSISGSTWRSGDWWTKVKSSGAPNDCFEGFKSISDTKAAVAKGADATFEQLVKVNEALKRIAAFEPAKVVSVSAQPQPVDVSALPPPTPEQQQHPN